MRGIVNNKRLHNNALHQTGREGAAGFLRRRPVVEERPAGERECCAGRGDARQLSGYALRNTEEEI
jgi:hypothetical protein